MRSRISVNIGVRKRSEAPSWVRKTPSGSSLELAVALARTTS